MIVEARNKRRAGTMEVSTVGLGVPILILGRKEQSEAHPLKKEEENGSNIARDP